MGSAAVGTHATAHATSKLVRLPPATTIQTESPCQDSSHAAPVLPTVKTVCQDDLSAEIQNKCRGCVPGRPYQSALPRDLTLKNVNLLTVRNEWVVLLCLAVLRV